MFLSWVPWDGAHSLQDKWGGDEVLSEAAPKDSSDESLQQRDGPNFVWLLPCRAISKISFYYPGNRCQTSTLLQRLSSHLLDQLLVEAELSEIGLRFLVIMWCTMYDCDANALLDDSLPLCWRHALTTSVTTSSPSATPRPQTLERSILGSARLRQKIWKRTER